MTPIFSPLMPLASVSSVSVAVTVIEADDEPLERVNEPAGSGVFLAALLDEDHERAVAG